jgi:hypothetical protein
VVEQFIAAEERHSHGSAMTSCSPCRPATSQAQDLPERVTAGEKRP